METTEAQDAADMGRLAQGHDAALNDLMQRHGERLFHYLVRQLRNEGDAEDLAQETFVRVYQNRARFDQKAKFTAWLYTIATNLVRDRFRWQARHSQVSLEAENEHTGASLGASLAEQGSGPLEKLQQEERAESVRQAVAKLPEDLRTALILSEYEKHSQAEIAVITGCSVKAVESRILRARQQLRSRLQKLPEFR